VLAAILNVTPDSFSDGGTHRDDPAAAALAGMVGFRNVAVHQYEQLDMGVLRWVVDSGYRDWIRLGEALGVAIRP
jgi:hypothetical protein